MYTPKLAHSASNGLGIGSGSLEPSGAIPARAVCYPRLMLDRRSFAKVVGVGASLWSARAAASPVEVGTSAQLFVDRVLVREARSVCFTLHPAEKHPANPLLKADRPWEGWRVTLYGSVIFDHEERLFKMWYLAEPVGVFGPEPNGPSSDNPVCYATSRDGIHWDKPLVGKLAATGGMRHNAVLFATHLPSIRKDNAGPNPARRYKMICYISFPKEARGYHTMVSPDGLNWSRFSATPICPHRDVVTGYYDERLKLWVALGKYETSVRGFKRRIFLGVTSPDFVNWSAPEVALSPDFEDDAGSLARIEQVRPMLDRPDDPALMRTEFYGTGFHATESCTLAFPWVFTINNSARYGNDEGPFEVQLAVTRDLKQWQRPFRTPAIPRGEVGDWESGLQMTASQTVRVGDEIWLYYCGANHTHGAPVLYRQDDPGRKGKYTSSIGLAKWKLDRFVSADGPAQGGTLTTVPLVYSGNRLEINADSAAGGRVQVELLDVAGRSLALSRPFGGDNLRHTVRWTDAALVAERRGQPVALRFHLHDASLYSFAFRQV
jgi:hypothetical protein